MAQTLLSDLVTQPTKLQAQHDQVKALGNLIVVAHSTRQVGKVCGDIGSLLEVQLAPGVHITVALDPAAMRTHEEVVGVHPSHLAAKHRNGVLSQAPLAHRAIAVPASPRQRHDEFQAFTEKTLVERRPECAFYQLYVLIEESNILAAVKYEEVLLVFTRPIQIRTQTRTTTDHLPELRSEE